MCFFVIFNDQLSQINVFAGFFCPRDFLVSAGKFFDLERFRFLVLVSPDTQKIICNFLSEISLEEVKIFQNLCRKCASREAPEGISLQIALFPFFVCVFFFEGSSLKKLKVLHWWSWLMFSVGFFAIFACYDDPSISITAG